MQDGVWRWCMGSIRIGESRLVRGFVPHLTPDTATVRHRSTAARGPRQIPDRTLRPSASVGRTRYSRRLRGQSMGAAAVSARAHGLARQFGASAEDAYADFRAVLGQIIEVVRDSDRLRQEARRAEHGTCSAPRTARDLRGAAVLVHSCFGWRTLDPIVGAGITVGGTAADMFNGRRRTRRDSEHGDVPCVPRRRIDLTLRPEHVLVRAFASGVATAAGTGTLVVTIDTAEIAATALGRCCPRRRSQR